MRQASKGTSVPTPKELVLEKAAELAGDQNDYPQTPEEHKLEDPFALALAAAGFTKGMVLSVHKRADGVFAVVTVDGRKFYLTI